MNWPLPPVALLPLLIAGQGVLALAGLAVAFYAARERDYNACCAATVLAVAAGAWAGARAAGVPGWIGVPAVLIEAATVTVYVRHVRRPR